MLRRLFALCVGLLAVVALALPVRMVTAAERQDFHFEGHEPPKNWNALTATDKELALYNFPPRPTDPESLKRWEAVVSNVKWVKPEFKRGRVRRRPQGEILAPMGAPARSQGETIQPMSSPAVNCDGVKTFCTFNWSGVVSKTTYTRAVGTWKTPFAWAGTSNRPAYSAHWVGLGGTGTNPLIQLGTESDVMADGSGQYYAWAEIVKTSRDTNGQLIIPNFTYNVGDRIYADVWWTESAGVGTAHFYITDLDTGSATSWEWSNITNYAGVTSSAEWIAERPTVDVPTYYLTEPYYSGSPTEWDRSHFYDVQAGTVSSVYFPDPAATTTVYDKIKDTSSTYLLQGVTTINSTGDFDTVWYHFN